MNIKRKQGEIKDIGCLMQDVRSGTCDLLAHTIAKSWCKRVASGTCDPLAFNTFVKYRVSKNVLYRVSEKY